jgi:hypothetical protein
MDGHVHPYRSTNADASSALSATLMPRYPSSGFSRWNSA